MKTFFCLALAIMVLATATATTAFAASKTNRVSIRYVPPENPTHQQVYARLKQNLMLERLQVFLSPFRLPRTIRISLTGCDGEADAWYEDDDITICYEYVYDLWTNRLEETTLSGVAPIDTVLGPLFEATLHEFAHALFDILESPVLGREEDAADQVAAYILLNLGKPMARRTISGTAHAYRFEETRAGGGCSAERFSNEHETPAQRGYNQMCLAYGSDKKLFADYVSQGYLPKERAEFCDEEYFQIQDAFEILFHPHLDLDLAEKILDRVRACESDGNSVPGDWEHCVPVRLE
ncbi:MAG: DUF4344 domain-containing metallopeptidase [candidate division Zixibacteria bacterium]